MKDAPLIVIVDDEKDVLDSLYRVFRNDFRVMAFQNTQKAIKFIKDYQKEIPIVISDFKMGEISGLDFLSLVKQKAPKSIRIILSGQIEVQHLSESINENIIHKFFMKPWDNEILKVQINEVLKTRRLMQENEQFKTLSITDPVTHLTNHRFFQEKLSEVFNLSNTDSPFSLIMVDVDHFKKFNDNYGHPTGDKLLNQIGRRIKDSLTNSIAYCSRYGGEEFAIILPDTSKEQALSFAEDIRISFESKPFTDGLSSPIFVTLSLGVASYPSDANTKNDIIEMADKALYQAKKSGRNKVCA